MTRLIASIQIERIPFDGWGSKYIDHGDNLYVAREGCYIDEEDLSYLKMADIKFHANYVPEQAQWNSAVWGDDEWAFPDDFPDYRNGKD